MLSPPPGSVTVRSRASGGSFPGIVTMGPGIRGVGMAAAPAVSSASMR